MKQEKTSQPEGSKKDKKNRLILLDKHTIQLTVLNHVHQVKLSNVKCVKSDNSYCTFHLLKGKPIMITSSLKNCLKVLPQSRFQQIDKSTIINLQHIKNVKKEKGKKWIFFRYVSLPFKIAVRKTKNFMFWYKKWKK